MSSLSWWIVLISMSNTVSVSQMINTESNLDAIKASSFYLLSHSQHCSSPVFLGLKYSFTGAGPSCEIEQGSQWRREGGAEVDAIADCQTVSVDERSDSFSKIQLPFSLRLFLFYTRLFRALLPQLQPPFERLALPRVQLGPRPEPLDVRHDRVDDGGAGSRA